MVALRCACKSLRCRTISPPCPQPCAFRRIRLLLPLHCTSCDATRLLPSHRHQGVHVDGAPPLRSHVTPRLCTQSTGEHDASPLVGGGRSPSARGRGWMEGRRAGGGGVGSIRGEFGTRPWWLALLACGGAHWPLALQPSAMTSRHPHCRGHPPLGGESRMQLLPMASSPDGLISARAVITKTPGWVVLTTTSNVNVTQGVRGGGCTGGGGGVGSVRGGGGFRASSISRWGLSQRLPKSALEIAWLAHSKGSLLGAWATRVASKGVQGLNPVPPAPGGVMKAYTATTTIKIHKEDTVEISGFIFL